MQIDDKVINLIKTGAVGILPTDTIFGIVASVRHPKSLARIYEIKGRPANKQMVHLIGDISQLREMGIYVEEPELRHLSEVWPGPVSVIFDCDDTLPDSHCGTFTIAVRLPGDLALQEVLKKTGPLVATSVNKSGMPPHTNLEKIRQEFPDLDFYVNGLSGTVPSRLCRLKKGQPLEWIERS